MSCPLGSKSSIIHFNSAGRIHKNCTGNSRRTLDREPGTTFAKVQIEIYSYFQEENGKLSPVYREVTVSKRYASKIIAKYDERMEEAKK